MKIGEPHAFGGQAVEMRCLVDLAAVASDIAIAQVIGQYDNDVRLQRFCGLGRPCFRAVDDEQGQHDCEGVSHCVLAFPSEVILDAKACD